MATEEEIAKIKLTEPRDYNAKILQLEMKGSIHGLDILTKEVIELRKELVKANDNHKALEEKIDLEFLKMREFVVDSNKKLLEDIRLFISKGDGSSFKVQKVSEISNKEACETFSGFSPWKDPSANVSREHDVENSERVSREHDVFTVSVVFAEVENSERVSSKTDDVARIAIEQVLSEVASDINGQEVTDVNEVSARLMVM